jgi:hypothetical protein
MFSLVEIRNVSEKPAASIFWMDESPLHCWNFHQDIQYFSNICNEADIQKKYYHPLRSTAMYTKPIQQYACGGTKWFLD